MKKMVDGVVMDCTPEEIAEYEGIEAALKLQRLQQEQLISLANLKKVRDEGKLAPILVEGNTFDLDKEAQNNINNTIDSFEAVRLEAVSLGWVDDGTVPWTLSDNSTVPVTLANLQVVREAGVRRGLRLHMEYNVAKAAMLS